MTLAQRCDNFVKTLGVPITKFCKNIGLSRTALYDWQHGKLKLSDNTLARIEQYITQYGF